jgi:glycosyltransferase involved in cell wall biosynthesis
MLLHPSIALNVDVCGGIERVALAELAGLERCGHQADMYVSALTGEHPQVRVLRDSGWQHRLRQWSYYLRFLRCARSCEILHGHYTPALALLAPQRALIHLHGLKVCELPLYRRFPDRLRKANFLCVAHHIADKFRDRYPDLPAENVHVLYNAVDETLFAPPLMPPDSAVVNITYHSLWEEPKGVFELLQAAELLEQKRKDFRVYLVGSALFEGAGAEQQETQRRVEEWAGRLSTVELVGPLNHPDLAVHLKRMHIGAFPSNHEDPFPLVPLEMMAAGLPVVAFDLGGPKEAIVDGQTGFLVPNKDVSALAAALERLIDNEQLRREMAVKARRHVEQNFTWDRHIERLLEIYEQITQGNGGRSSAS